jgi:hypothetical protein
VSRYDEPMWRSRTGRRPTRRGPTIVTDVWISPFVVSVPRTGRPRCAAWFRRREFVRSIDHHEIAARHPLLRSSISGAGGTGVRTRRAIADRTKWGRPRRRPAATTAPAPRTISRRSSSGRTSRRDRQGDWDTRRTVPSAGPPAWTCPADPRRRAEKTQPSTARASLSNVMFIVRRLRAERRPRPTVTGVNILRNRLR